MPDRVLGAIVGTLLGSLLTILGWILPLSARLATLEANQSQMSRQLDKTAQRVETIWDRLQARSQFRGDMP